MVSWCRRLASSRECRNEMVRPRSGARPLRGRLFAVQPGPIPRQLRSAPAYSAGSCQSRESFGSFAAACSAGGLLRLIGLSVRCCGVASC